MPQGNNRIGSGCLVLLGGGIMLVVIALVGFMGLATSLGSLIFERGPGVAVLNITGELVDEQVVLQQLKELVSNPDTKALVVRVESPGGEVAVAEEIYHGIRRVREENNYPVVASMGGVAASGGYYVCCAAQRIFANKSTLTGSLGVIIEYPNAEALLGQLGIAFETVSTGEFKDTGSYGRALTEKQRAHMQQVVDDFHNMFIELVVTARPLEEAEVRALADGRVFTGRQALASSLVDELGDLDTAISFAARTAGLPEDARVIRANEPSVRWFSLLERLDWATSRLKSRSWMPKYLLR